MSSLAGPRLQQFDANMNPLCGGRPGPNCRAWEPSLALAIISLSLASLWLSSSPAQAAEEVCASNGQQVKVSGDFAHRKDRPSVTIEGAADAAAFREEINGTNFTVTIAHLPAGKYTIAIGEAETLASAAGERLFDVTSGDVSLAKDFDIFAAAGGARKVCSITGAVEHEDDSIKGPLTISFAASKGAAKFNTFEVKNSSGASVVAFSASEMADAFSAAAMRVPEIKRRRPSGAIPSKPLKARADDLIRRMSLAEKVGQLQGGMSGAPGIQRLGLPGYNYWNEALHGVANNGIATVFPEPVGMASTFNPELLHQAGHVVGLEGRAKFNDYASKHNGDSKWWTGLTFWTPNINIFRDPRWGRGQETYGEDPVSHRRHCAWSSSKESRATTPITCWRWPAPNITRSTAARKRSAIVSMPQPSERDLYETYLPQFEMAVREGHVAGVMGAYNALNGVPAAPALSCSPTCCASNGDLRVTSSRIATRSTTSGPRAASLREHARRGRRRRGQGRLRSLLRRRLQRFGAGGSTRTDHGKGN